MATPNPASPSILDAAHERLNLAFRYLEESARALKGGESPLDLAERDAIAAGITKSWEDHCAALEADIESLRNENETLRAETIRLSNDLQALQQDYLDLQQVADHVADKLDNQVRQLELIR